MSGPPGLMCVLGRVGGKTHVREAGFCRTPNRSDSPIRFMTAQELIMDYFDLLPQRSAEDLLKHLFSAQTNASESPQNSPDLPDTDQPKQNLSVPQLIQDDRSGLSQPKSPNMDVKSSGSQSHSCVCVCLCVRINTKQIQGMPGVKKLE